MANKTLIILAIFFVSFDFCTSECPYGIYESGLSQDDRDYIVNQHNYLRGLVASGQVPGQPKATNMKQMQYSIELEIKGQEISNTCEFKHVPVTGTTWDWVGQNLFLSMSTGNANGSHWESAIQAWFKEHEKYIFGGEGAGHYTQLVWADTDNVGCGYTYYKKDGTYPYQKFYVCNYGPGGNYKGEPPYKT